jgi:hypothetical protein
LPAPGGPRKITATLRKLSSTMQLAPEFDPLASACTVG